MKIYREYENFIEKLYWFEGKRKINEYQKKLLQLMFTPLPNDPLVEESKANGDTDGYQIVLPNELIVNIALLLDFNRFKFKDFSSGITGDDDIDESLVFRGLVPNDSNKENTLDTKDDNIETNVDVNQGM